jgi:hypothetical protein
LTPAGIFFLSFPPPQNFFFVSAVTADRAVKCRLRRAWGRFH